MLSQAASLSSLPMSFSTDSYAQDHATLSVRRDRDQESAPESDNIFSAHLLHDGLSRFSTSSGEIASSGSSGQSPSQPLPMLEMYSLQSNISRTPQIELRYPRLASRLTKEKNKTVWGKRDFARTFIIPSQGEDLAEDVAIFSILALPTELLVHILSYLPSQDFLHINEVCKKFYGVSTSSSDIKAHTLTVLNRIDPQGIMAQELSQRFTGLLNVCKEEVYSDDLNNIKSFLQEWQSYVSTLNKSIKALLPFYRRLGGYELSKDYATVSKDILSKLSEIKNCKKAPPIISAFGSEETETYFILRKLTKTNGGGGQPIKLIRFS